MGGAMQLAGVEELRRSRHWLLGLGIFLILAGTLALAASVLATLASVILFGWILVFAGTLEGCYAFRQPKWGGVVLHVVNGTLGIVAGVLLLSHPGAGAVALTLLIAMFLMIAGAFRTVVSLVMRFPHWGWVLLSGVTTLALGVIIWGQMPGAALWVIGTFLGIDLIFTGWSWVMLSAALRREPKTA